MCYTIKKKGMVQYGHSVKETCLKTSLLLMREGNLEGKKSTLRRTFHGVSFITFPPLKLHYSSIPWKKMWSLKKPNCMCMPDASFVKPSISCELSPLGLSFIIFYKTDKEDFLLQKMYSLGPNTKKTLLIRGLPSKSMEFLV